MKTVTIEKLYACFYGVRVTEDGKLPCCHKVRGIKKAKELAAMLTA